MIRAPQEIAPKFRLELGAIGQGQVEDAPGVERKLRVGFEGS